MNAGDLCYLENGQKVEYAGKIGGQHFVRFLYTTNTSEAGEEEWSSETVTPVKKVFEQEPTEVWGKTVTDMQATVSKLLEQKKALDAEIREINKAKTAMSEAANTLPDVATALDFHEGRINYIVVDRYGDIVIQDFNKVVKGEECRPYHTEMKLVCLFGTDRNRKTRWKMNAYYDGSGSWTEIIPFQTLEEAEDHVRKLFEDELVKWRAGEKHTLNKFTSSTLVTWPADWLAAVESHNEKQKADKIEKLRKELAALEGDTNV